MLEQGATAGELKRAAVELAAPDARQGGCDRCSCAPTGDIVEVVGRYVDLRRAGSEWEGCAHSTTNEHRRSGERSEGFVHCFEGGAHHDVIGFLRVCGRVCRSWMRARNSGRMPHRHVPLRKPGRRRPGG